MKNRPPDTDVDTEEINKYPTFPWDIPDCKSILMHYM